MYLIFLLLISLLFVVECVFYKVLDLSFPNFNSLFSVYLSITSALFFLLIFLLFKIITTKDKNKWGHILRFSSSLLLVFLPKMLVAFLFLIECIFFLYHYVYHHFVQFDFVLLTKSILVVGFIFFLIIIHGIVIGRYKFRVIKKTICFDDLPPAFDGFKLLQISDIHSGSLSNKKEILNGINLINQQSADLIVFTGDLVNSHPNEMDDWTEVFGQIKKAPFGNFAILGNHDYGSHNGHVSKEKLENAHANLSAIHQKIGFELLLNESRIIEKNSQKINLLGVENFGAPPFAQHGNLKKAFENTGPNDFSILLSHDPSHFDLEVKNHEKHIPLTLSGHTHGMQFGFEIFGFKWSPVKYKYKKWAGLYQENNRYLYVNRGFGYIGIPARIGIWPEITVIELRNKHFFSKP
jgi:uncharacterized protein